jgi:hypothetical protein
MVLQWDNDFFSLSQPNPSPVDLDLVSDKEQWRDNFWNEYE